jgi:hypothetical protein
MLTDFLILLGMFAAFVLVCFIADAIGLSLSDRSYAARTDHKNKE